MKIIIAPDSFKGSLGAGEISRRIAEGIARVVPDAGCILMPVADGGEGTVDAFLTGAGGTLQFATVHGPLGITVPAAYGLLPDGTGVIEMAAASGLTLVGEARRNPLLTTTRGTGELIQTLLDGGCRRIIIGIGGSATNDGGVGMAQALGVSFLDSEGRELGPGGGALSALARIDRSGIDPRLAECEIIIASDVTNPLVGERGASAVYGPQKGATPDMVRVLDANLGRLADIIENETGLRVHELPGAGAAGGLGAGLIAFCGAHIASGIDTVLDAVGFDAAVSDADLVFTGEGRIDGQSVYGKVPVGVALRAREATRGRQTKLPVIAIVGGIGPGAEAVYGYGIDAIISIVNGPMSLADAMEQTGPLLADAAERTMRLVMAGRTLSRV